MVDTIYGYGNAPHGLQELLSRMSKRLDSHDLNFIQLGHLTKNKITNVRQWKFYGQGKDNVLLRLIKSYAVDCMHSGTWSKMSWTGQGMFAYTYTFDDHVTDEEIINMFGRLSKTIPPHIL